MVMNLRAILKDSSFLSQLLSTIAVAFGGMLLSVFVFRLYALLTTGSWVVASGTMNDIRMMQLFSELGTFFFAALFLAYLFSDRTAIYLQLNKPTISLSLLTVVAVLLSIPFLNLTVYLNERIALPESMSALESWLKQMEEDLQYLTIRMLQTDSVSVLIFNIFLIGLVAAVSEELMFRGVAIRVFEKFVKNPHVVIWTVAFIFSAIHLQFYGFIPKFLLGALMGYLLLWTKSLWIPIIAHFTNNTFAVLAYYLSPDADVREQLDLIGTGDTLWLAILSLVVVGAVCWYIAKICGTHTNAAARRTPTLL
jgi:membrane protease YdiL (CAAX protease family)